MIVYGLGSQRIHHHFSPPFGSEDFFGSLFPSIGLFVAMISKDLALTELANEKKWQGVNVAVASCCDVPPWAFELLGKFEFGPKKTKMNESWIPGDSIRDLLIP